MSTLHATLVQTAPPELDGPDADRLIHGTPEFTTWNIEDRGDLFCGIWRSTAGKWRVSYDEWEYFNILSGYSILTPKDGDPIHLKAGDRHIIRPGFSGTWEVIETTTKDYVIRA